MSRPYPPLSIYCINLDSRPDRWEHLQSIIKNTPIEHSIIRFPGITAANGIEGCRQSHNAIIRKAKEEGLPWVGIMEDDCTLYDHFSSEFPTILNELWIHKHEWEIFNSGPIDITSISRFEGKLVRIYNCTCAQFIIIQSSSYDKLINKFDDSSISTTDKPIDQYYRVLCSNKILTSIPPLTYQYASKSDIQSFNIGESNEFQKAWDKVMMFA
jgi:hypothetical protein